MMTTGDLIGTIREDLRATLTGRIDHDDLSWVLEHAAREVVQSLMNHGVWAEHPMDAVDHVQAATAELYAEACGEIAALKIDLAAARLALAERQSAEVIRGQP